MGNWFKKGTGLVVLEEASRVVTTFSEEFYFADPGGAEIIIDVSAVADPAGQISGLAVQNKTDEGEFVDVFNFGALAIDEVGRYIFVASPHQLDAGLYTVAPIQQVMPTQGRLRITHGEDNPITYKVKMRNIGQ